MRPGSLPIDRAQLKALVLDVDGTLYRQRPVRAVMLWKLLRAHATRPREGLETLRLLQAYRRAQESLREQPEQVDDPATRQLELACGRTGVPADVAATYVGRWMEEEPLRAVARSVQPGVHGFLALARERGMRLGVVSDYPAARKLEAMGLSQAFDVVVSAQDADVCAFKPSPRGLQAALARLSVTNHEALYIGDRPEVDAVAAANAGVACVIVGRSRAAAADHWVPMRGYRELQDAIFS